MWSSYVGEYNTWSSYLGEYNILRRLILASTRLDILAWFKGKVPHISYCEPWRWPWSIPLTRKIGMRIVCSEVRNRALCTSCAGLSLMHSLHVGL